MMMDEQSPPAESPTEDPLVARVRELDSTARQARVTANRPSVEVSADVLVGFMTRLKQESDLHFDMLCSHTVVDWLEEELFQLVYQLYSTRHQNYLQVSVFVSRDNPEVPSVSGVWKVAEWQEREAYDLFGILYDDHPDLRRLFLEDDWEGFPLRKDYKDDFMLDGPKI